MFLQSTFLVHSNQIFYDVLAHFIFFPNNKILLLCVVQIEFESFTSFTSIKVNSHVLVFFSCCCQSVPSKFCDVRPLALPVTHSGNSKCFFSTQSQSTLVGMCLCSLAFLLFNLLRSLHFYMCRNPNSACVGMKNPNFYLTNETNCRNNLTETSLHFTSFSVWRYYNSNNVLHYY